MFVGRGSRAVSNSAVPEPSERDVFEMKKNQTVLMFIFEI